MQAMYHLDRKKGRNRKRRLLNLSWRNLLKVGFPKRDCQDLKEDILPPPGTGHSAEEPNDIRERPDTPEISPGEARAPL
jgi:hypothetical protein